MGALALGVATRAVVSRAKRADALVTRRDVGARGAIGGVRRERVREGATRAVVSALEVDERAASRAERPARARRAHDGAVGLLRREGRKGEGWGRGAGEGASVSRSARGSGGARRPARRGAITFVLSRENERGVAFPFERAWQPPGAPCSTDTSRCQDRHSSRSSWHARRVLRARGARLDVSSARASTRLSDDRGDSTSSYVCFRGRNIRRSRQRPARYTDARYAPKEKAHTLVAISRRSGTFLHSLFVHDTPRRRALSPPPTPSRVRPGPTVGQDGEESQGKTSSRCVIAPPSRPLPPFPPARRASVSHARPPPPRR